MSPPCLESQGCHLIPLCYLLSCSSALSCYPFCLIVFCLLALSFKLFPENSSIFTLRDRLFCMAPVQQLGEVSCSMVWAACRHMTQIFAAMHLYHFCFVLYGSCLAVRRSKLVGGMCSMLPYDTGICCYAFIYIYIYFFFLLLLSIPFLYFFKNWYR